MPSLCGAFLVLALTLICHQEKAQAKFVTTTSGNYIGSYDNVKRVYSYKGIRFGTAGRWEMPRPYVPSTVSSTGIPANTFGDMCPQYRRETKTFEGSEDCLFVNVWVPDRPAQQGHVPLPVLVWIYGGGFVNGYSHERDYDGANLAGEEGNAIIVSINYRVGAMGFFSGAANWKNGDPNNSGNFGLADQRLGLQWVQDNIAQFGGDRGKVTIFGESAGGISVCLQILSPFSAGLFQRAIIESGPCDFIGPIEIQQTSSQLLADQLQCTGDNTLACLKSKTLDQVQQAAFAMGGLTTFGNYQFAPYLDNYIIPEQPAVLFEQGRFNRVPIIIGSNKDEMGLFVIGNPDWLNPSDTAYAAMLKEYGLDDSEVMSAYQASNFGGDNRAALQALLGDRFFICGARRMTRTFDRYRVPSFLYSFNHRPSSGILSSDTVAWTGAFHYAEVPFVFGNLPSATTLIGTPTTEEARMGRVMRTWWRRFAASGNPNGAIPGGGSSTTVPEQVGYWPQYSTAADINMNIETSISLQSNRYTRCQAWDNFIQKNIPDSARASNHVGEFGEDEKSSTSNATLIIIVSAGLGFCLLLTLAVLFLRGRGSHPASSGAGQPMTPMSTAEQRA